MEKGIVKWFNNKMKYGFILSQDGTEIFIHFSEIMTEGYKTVKRGDLVEYEKVKTERGFKAVHVVKLGEIPKDKRSPYLPPHRRTA